jgi:hypothetical protein
VAKKKTAEADVKLDDRGRPIQEEDDLDLGDNCIIVSQESVAEEASEPAEPLTKKKPRGRKRSR